MGTLQLGPRRLNYEDVGSGLPILLIHGFTNYGMSWAPQLAPLVHSGHRVILPDLYGHGASSPAAEICTVPDLARDMLKPSFNDHPLAPVRTMSTFVIPTSRQCPRRFQKLVTGQHPVWWTVI